MKTSIISCSCNNTRTVYGIVAAGYRNQSVSEVIVVDDKSSDNTVYWMDQLINHYSFDELQGERNSRKNFSMSRGKYTNGSVFLFFDANISGTKEKDIRMLSNYIREIGIQAENYIGLYLQSRQTFHFEQTTRIFQLGNKNMRYMSLNGRRSKATALKAMEKSVSEGLEITITFLSNTGLIAKRDGDKVQNAENCSQPSIVNARNELTHKIKIISEKINEMQLF